MVCADSLQVSRARSYLGSPSGGHTISSTGVPPSTPGLSMPFDYDVTFLLLADPAGSAEGSHNPVRATPAGLHTHTVWPDPLSLATTHGISLPAGTEMFHFPAFPPHTLYIQVRVTAHDCCGVSPFGHPRITVRLPTPRGLSQATTSFFGSWCQGIHHVPFTTSTTENKDARVHCAVLKQPPAPVPHERHQRHEATHAPRPVCPPEPARRSHQPPTGSCCLRTQQCAENDPPPPTTTRSHPHPRQAQARSCTRTPEGEAHQQLMFHP